MNVDIEKVSRYLMEIKERRHDLGRLLGENSDPALLADPWRLRGLKYTLVEMAEAMANTLQHILAKDMGQPVTGYVETILKAGDKGILPPMIVGKLKPFFDFRNSLIHRYWIISDEKLVQLLRENIGDFDDFVESIENYLKSSPSKQR